MLSGADPVYDTSTWTGVNTIIATSKNALTQVQQQQANFNLIASKSLGPNTYTYSQSSLTTISTKYDSAQASSYGVTNPINGNSGFSIDIRTNFATYQNSQSFSYPIYMQRYMFQTVIYNNMKDLISSASQAANSNTITAANSALNSVTDFVSQISSFKGTIEDYTSKGDDYVNYVQIGFTVYYAICLGCSCLMIVGTVAFAFCGWLKCRCLSHFGWVIVSIFMIIGFLLATILFPVSVVLIEVCGVISLDQLAVNKKIIPDSVWNQTGICLVGNGDIYTKYKLGDQLGFASSISSSLDLIKQIYNPATGTLIMNVTNQYVTNVKSYLTSL